MYGDTAVMRKRVAQLREQGTDIRSTAAHLVARVEHVSWTGRAADAMRERVRDRAAQLRDCAARHEGAADALDHHLREVDGHKDAIAQIERKASSLVLEAQTRVAQVATHAHPDDVQHAATEEDQQLASFTPPPAGHRDWLSVELPGL